MTKGFILAIAAAAFSAALIDGASVSTPSCVELGDSVSVTFLDHTDVRSGDWIGFIPATVDLSSGETPDTRNDNWMWTCGSQSCNSSPRSGSGTFRSPNFNRFSEWVAVLARNGDGPTFSIVTTSSPFEVKSTCATTPATTTDTTATTATPVTDSKSNGISQEAINSLRSDIADLIIGRNGKIALAAQFLRLGFHDCVGGCDGCVDLGFHDNKGLDVPIDALIPIVDRHGGIFSRADIWAMAVLVGADVSQVGNFKVDFDYLDFGRVDCEDANSVCFGETGDEQPCDATHGPHHHIPGLNTNTAELFKFFDEEFGFDTRQTVAIMGAHTIGQAHKKNSGVDGEHGWLLENRVLDNTYYKEIVGGRNSGDRTSNLINQAPNWIRHFENNRDVPGMPNQRYWIGLPEGRNGRVIVMLNIDIALVRDLNDSNYRSDIGRVNCNFVTRNNVDGPTCPGSGQALREAARYRFNNRTWLRDFEDVLRLMLMNGYDVDDSDCIGNGVCRLVPN